MFCVVPISFYNKMTVKQQNNAGARRLLGGVKRPLSQRQWLLRPVLNKLVLESNEEVFF